MRHSASMSIKWWMCARVKSPKSGHSYSSPPLRLPMPTHRQKTGSTNDPQSVYFGSRFCNSNHYNDVIMSLIASQITSLTIVCSTGYSGADQRKHQSAWLAFVLGIHWWPMNSPHKGPVTRKMFPSDNVIMEICHKWSILVDFKVWMVSFHASFPILDKRMKTNLIQ